MGSANIHLMVNLWRRWGSARTRLVLLLAVAAGVNLSWAGAVTFRVLVDLPARSRIGPLAFAELSRATDLSNGLVFYPIGGLGSAMLSLATWLTARGARASPSVRVAAGVAAVSTLLVLVVTIRAAPIMFQIGSAPDDAAALALLADRFARLSQLRALLADLAATALLAALTVCAVGAGEQRP
jgi:hypothetical protein